MISATMDRIIEVEQKVLLKNAFGSMTYTGVTLFSGRTSVQEQMVTESYDSGGGGYHQVAITLFTTRWNPIFLDYTLMIRYRGHLYTILSVKEIGRHDIHQITAKRIQNKEDY